MDRVGHANNPPAVVIELPPRIGTIREEGRPILIADKLPRLPRPAPPVINPPANPMPNANVRGGGSEFLEQFFWIRGYEGGWVIIKIAMWILAIGTLGIVPGIIYSCVYGEGD